MTTLSPDWKSVSSEYMTMLCASVVFFVMTIFERDGALMNPAMVSYASSNSAVVSCEAADWPRCTFS